MNIYTFELGLHNISNHCDYFDILAGASYQATNRDSRKFTNQHSPERNPPIKRQIATRGYNINGLVTKVDVLMGGLFFPL